MAAPTLVGSTVAVSTAAVSLAWPTGTAAKDLALLLVECQPTQTAAAPTGFVELPGSPITAGSDSSGTRLIAFTREYVDGLGNVAVADPGDHVVARLITIRHPDGVPLINAVQTAALGSASTAAQMPGLTTSRLDCLVLALVANSSDTTTAQASGWANASLVSFAERYDSNTTNGTGGGISVASGTLASDGEVAPSTATLLTASQQALLTIAFSPPLPPQPPEGAMPFVKVWDGGEWLLGQPKRWTGTEWQPVHYRISDGDWVA